MLRRKSVIALSAALCGVNAAFGQIVPNAGNPPAPPALPAAQAPNAAQQPPQSKSIARGVFNTSFEVKTIACSPDGQLLAIANGGPAVLLQPDGTKVEVGPRVCDNPLLQQAFNQFHANVHHPVEGGQGPAAPGLHNHRGAELTVTGCEAP